MEFFEFDTEFVSGHPNYMGVCSPWKKVVFCFGSSNAIDAKPAAQLQSQAVKTLAPAALSTKGAAIRR